MKFQRSIVNIRNRWGFPSDPFGDPIEFLRVERERLEKLSNAQDIGKGTSFDESRSIADQKEWIQAVEEVLQCEDNVVFEESA